MNYKRWIAHFEANRLNRPEPDWTSPFSMPEEKRCLLAVSLAEYQLGDGGGPCQLIARNAERFQGASEDVRRVVELWFAEEKEHSRLLAGAVRRVRGVFVESTFAFTLFCQTRRWMNVQFELLVLLLVEIVSTGYYRLLRRYVGDKPIADMCRLILRDEARHVEFHRERLSTQYPNGVSWFWRTRFRALSYACVAFLWLGHGRCLRALGASRAELFAQVARGTERLLRTLPQGRGAEPHARNVAVFSNPGMQR